MDRRSIAEVPEVFQAELERGEVFAAPDVKVLIVDDNVVNRKVARGFLKGYAFDLSEAESGPEAIRLVRETRYDIIFMDHMMPMMDGIEAAEIIRRDCGENGAAPTMIALTANAMEGMRERFLARGFQDFIAKPLDRKELHQLLLRWVPEERRQAREGGSEEGRALAPSSFAIPGIDMEAAARYCSGDEAGFLDLLELYHMDGERKAALLAELAGTDVSRYQVEVHALKSASANIGAMELSAMARAQEEAAGAGDAALIAQGFPPLLETYEALLAEIGSFLAQRRKQGAQAEKLPALSPEELRSRTRAALERLEDFRSQECAAIVEDLLLHHMPQAAEEGLLEIQAQLRLYEDDNAEDLLRQLLGRLEEEDGSQ